MIRPWPLTQRHWVHHLRSWTRNISTVPKSVTCDISDKVQAHKFHFEKKEIPRPRESLSFLFMTFNQLSLYSLFSFAEAFNHFLLNLFLVRVTWTWKKQPFYSHFIFQLFNKVQLFIIFSFSSFFKDWIVNFEHWNELKWVVSRIKSDNSSKGPSGERSRLTYQEQDKGRTNDLYSGIITRFRTFIGNEIFRIWNWLSCWLYMHLQEKLSQRG